MKPRAHSDHEHGHDHDHGHEHEGPGHVHGVVDPAITTSERGIWAIKWSFVVLFVTSLLQAVVVALSGSVGLLADTIHNVGDAATAVPLWIAFALSRWKPTRRFTYGFGKVEDLAGLAVVLTIAISAVVAAYETIDRFVHPREVTYLWAVMLASITGFAGNEMAAWVRIKVGKEIESAALIADGHHARIDGLTSLAVLFGALGVWLGYPLADPIVGVLITLAIAQIVWQSSKAVFARMLDGVDWRVIEQVEVAAREVPGVQQVTDMRARWLGHRLHADLSVAVAAALSVAEGHAVAKEVRHRLMHKLPYLSSVAVHVDPADEAGEAFHRIHEHSHDGLPKHSH